MKKGLVILLVMMALLLGLVLYTKYFQSAGFRVVFFNIGQGDSTLIQFENGQKMLVDCGPDKKILSKLGDYLPFYDRRIDYLLVTHYDIDHYGGCVDVLKRYEVGMVIENGVEKEYDLYWREWSNMIERLKIKRLKISERVNWAIASTTLEFFSPDSALGLLDKDKEGNNSSIVFKLTHDEDSFLFTGDAEVPLENALIDKYCVRSPLCHPVSQRDPFGKNGDPCLGLGDCLDSRFRGNDNVECPALHARYLKVGHHGSDSSSDDAFIGAVAPQTAIISVGKNTFGHPSRRVLKHLERAEVNVLRTDEVGDVKF